MSERLTVEHTGWATQATVGEDGVVRNVALSGNRSRNGYDIPASAYGSESRVEELYLNRLIFMDHLPPDQAHQPLRRSSEDLAGEIIAVRMVGGRPYGDIKTEGAPQGERFRELVRGGFSGVGMSHTAYYTYNRERTSVESIESVETVDVVINPATNKSFSEQTAVDDRAEVENQNKALPILNFASGGRFGELIRESMDKDGLSTRGMAERLGCDAAVLADVVSGAKAAPSGERLDKLAEALGVSREQVIAAVHPPEQESPMYEKLTAEELIANRPDLVEAIAQEQVATKEAAAKLQAAEQAAEQAQAERDALAAKVEKFEAEQALIKRRQDIESELKDANLDMSDAVICSEQFINQLMRIDDPEGRQGLIQDRAMLCKHTQEQRELGSQPRTPATEAAGANSKKATHESFMKD